MRDCPSAWDLVPAPARLVSLPKELLPRHSCEAPEEQTEGGGGLPCGWVNEGARLQQVSSLTFGLAAS